MILSTCEPLFPEYKIWHLGKGSSIFILHSSWSYWKMKSQILLILLFSRAYGITSSLNFINSYLILNDSMIPELELDFMNMTDLTKTLCKPGHGLECGAKEDLDLGSQFLVSSRQCEGGGYPANEKCRWTFDVSDSCLPRVDCKYLDLIGNWRRG